MRHLTRAPALIALLVAIAASPASAQTAAAGDEETAIRAALQHYLLGQSSGDGSHYAQVFHPDARLFWMRDGEFNSLTSQAFIDRANGEPPADEAERERRITMVDVTGDAAVARIELDYPEVLITDYMSLLKVDGEWRIVNKIFHVAPKAAAGR